MKTAYLLIAALMPLVIAAFSAPASAATTSTVVIHAVMFTFVVSVAFHDFPTGVRIWQRIHLTVVKETRS